MSHSAPTGGPETGTDSGQNQPGGQGNGGQAGGANGTGDTSGTGTEDDEAQSLLAEMAKNDPEAALRAAQAEIEKWKGLSRKHEKSSRDNAAAKKRLDELESANKTELERAREAQAAAEDRERQAVAGHNRVIAAATHNVPVELIDFLGSGTEEEILDTAKTFAEVIDRRVREQAEARAVELLQSGWRPGNGQTDMGRSARPVESLRPGGAPSAGSSGASDKNTAFRNLFAH